MNNQEKKAVGTALLVIGIIVGIAAVVMFYESYTSFSAETMIHERYELSQYFGTEASDLNRAINLHREGKTYLLIGVITTIVSLGGVITGGLLISNSKKASDNNEAQDVKAMASIAKEADTAKKIKKYKELFDEGVITEEEYNNKKKELLDL